MKKVRYLIGAVGTIPTMGLVVPGAAAGVTHTSNARAKTVQLTSSSQLATGCGPTSLARGHDKINFSMFVAHVQSTDCISKVTGIISNGHVPDLLMRTRIYSINAKGAKTQVFSKLHGGDFASRGGIPITRFIQSVSEMYLPGVSQEVCAAVVSKSHTSHVPYPAACTTFKA